MAHEILAHVTCPDCGRRTAGERGAYWKCPHCGTAILGAGYANHLEVLARIANTTPLDERGRVSLETETVMAMARDAQKFACEGACGECEICRRTRRASRDVAIVLSILISILLAGALGFAR